MTQPLKLAVLVTSLTMLSLPTGAADVLTIAEYGEDGPHTYYQVTCSDSSRGSVVIDHQPRKVCAHPAQGTPQCHTSWTVREAAVKACQ